MVMSRMDLMQEMEKETTAKDLSMMTNDKTTHHLDEFFVSAVKTAYTCLR